VVHVYLEMHCTSEDNERGIASGHNDPDLSAAGKNQAIELGERYRGRWIDAVYCSDLLRARRTAELAFVPLGVPVTYDARLRECNYGDLNGQSRDELHANRLPYVDKPYPNGESWSDAAARTLALLEELIVNHAEDSVVIIGHSATRYALDSYMQQRPLEELVAEPWEWMPVWHWEWDINRN
jgi:2,3-bisphosphoglycerate-dependent phosphoglycerate mutase